MRALIISAVTFACLVLAGCGGSNSTPFTIQSGNWNITANSTSSPGNTFLAGGSLTQTGSTISGIVHIPNSTCFDPTQDIAVSGSVKGQKITLSSPAIANQTVTVNATASSATALSGTYSVTGTGCAGGDNGTVSATLVPSISGAWHGSLTSTVNPATVINVTATLTQSPTADADGLFEVTGTVTFTGSSCFTSGTIAQGLIAGSALGLDITTNDQPTAGGMIVAAVMDNPAIATSATGNYLVLTGNCAGDGGDGTLTKQ